MTIKFLRNMHQNALMHYTFLITNNRKNKNNYNNNINSE